jgi:hypothetical protein
LPHRHHFRLTSCYPETGKQRAPELPLSVVSRFE